MRRVHLGTSSLILLLYVVLVCAALPAAALAGAAPGGGRVAAAAVLSAAAILGGAAWAAHDRMLRRRCRELEAELASVRHASREAIDRLTAAEHQARGEAEQAARSRDEFVATVSHELRTPLNAVLGWARLLRMGKLDQTGAARAIETIERGASTQAQIVDEVLDASRIMRGELRLDLHPVDLAPVIEVAVDGVRPAAAARRIQVVIALSPSAGQVSGDQARLQQVIWNLVSNAVKFTPAGGRVEVRLDRQGGDVVITVKDTGMGIDPAFAPHLFEHFRQADSSSTRAHGGLGMGLALARHLVEAHGGTVRADSEGRGRGATFTVRLPAAAPRRTITVAAPPAGVDRSWPLAGLAQLRVLVVDDDPDSREVVREVLEQAGAQVEVAASTHEALLSIVQQPPDVLLSDLGMPEEDGYQLMRQVRALAPGAGGKIPAAALTAYTQAEDRSAAQEAGFQGYLSKPIDPAELTIAVARLAGRLH
jgi:signal transduction histidine kinase